MIKFYLERLRKKFDVRLNFKKVKGVDLVTVMINGHYISTCSLDDLKVSLQSVFMFYNLVL